MAIKNYLEQEDQPFQKPTGEIEGQKPQPPSINFGDSHSIFELLLSNTKELIILLDSQYIIQFISEKSKHQFAALFNVELQKGQNLLSVAAQDKKLLVKEIYEDVLKGNYRETESSHLVNGNTIHLRNSFSPAKDEQGQIVGIIINTQDITSYKKNQLALEEGELRWQFASEGANQGLWDWNIQTGYTYYSKSYKRLYGFGDNDITNHIDEWSTRIHPDDKHITSTALENHFSHSEPTYDSTYRIRGKDGVYRWILSRGMIVSRDENGRPLRMIGTHTDITRFKYTEANYKLLFYSNPLPMWTVDPATLRFLEVNDQAVAHYGYSREEFLNMTVRDIHPLEDLTDPNVSFANAQRSSSPYTLNNIQHQKKDGALIYVDITGHIIEQDGKKISLITCQDVTDKLMAEKRLQESEVKYRSLFINNPLPSWIYHIETHQFLEVNNAAIDHYGYSKDEFLQLTIEDIHPNEEKEIVTKAINEAIKNETSGGSWKHQKKNGEIIYVDVSSSRIDYKNRAARLVVIHDKTKEVQAEKELLQSNERFQLATLASSEVLWEWNVKTNQMYVSDALTKLFGWDVQESHQFGEWHAHIHPDDKEKTLQSFREAITNPTADRWAEEYRFLKKDGTYANIIDKVFIQRDSQGDAIKVVGAIQDISLQKRTEASLKVSNERYLFASRATSDAIWDLDLTDNTLLWGEGLFTLFGYKSDEVPYERWAALVHPDDVERVEASLIQAIKNTDQSIWRSQYRFRANNNTYRYIFDRGFILRDSSKKPYRLIGSLQDITDLKIKEKELLKSNERYKYVSLATSDIIWDWNLKKDQVLLSENYNKVFGWNLPENHKLPIKECIAYIHPDEQNMVRLEAKKAFNNPKCKHWECSFRYQKSNGAYAFVTLKGYIIRNKLGQGIRMIGAIQDITEKKLKEKQLTESNERFDAVLKATNDLIWDWNLETGNFYRDAEGMYKVYGIADHADIESIHNWLQRIHPEDNNQIQQIINDILHSTDQDTFEMEYRFRRDDNRYNFVYDRGIILRNNEGRPVRMIGAAQNITERKKLEMQLLKKELDKQKLISQATIETQEQERSEIGKELHDNVNQVLTTTKLYLDLSISNAEMKDELILKSSKNIIYVINEIRQLSRSLMNPSLGDLGLIESINELIDNVNLTARLKAKLAAAPSLEVSLTENQKLMVYRIVQEAINNALKHAKAQNVNITIHDNDQWVEMFIEDDGIGFNFDNVKKGSGLKHIQNRVYLANGTLNVNSGPGKGCLIMINFPKHTNPI